MPWIKTPRPGPQHPELVRAMSEALRGYPPEYGNSAGQGLPAEVARDSITGAHALVPEVLRGIFSGYRAMLDPSLPLSRKDHELIATVVSARNGCFY